MTSPSHKPPAAGPPPAMQGRPADPLPSTQARDGQGNRRATVCPPAAVARPQSAPGAAATGPGEGQGCSQPPGDQDSAWTIKTCPGTAISSAMSEAQLENGIRRILKDLPDVLWYHTHDSRRSPSGFPDLVAVGPGGVLYRELKTMRGKVTRAQDEWLFALTDAGQDADIWRPDSLLSGRIARELAAISGLKVPWPAGARGRRGGAGITEGRGELA